jgi:hypothetical protein
MNYLKYWRVVRYFINAKYGISQPDLEMLLFLYDEPYFTRAKFKEFDKVFSWDKDRFNRLVRKRMGREDIRRIEVAPRYL